MLRHGLTSSDNMEDGSILCCVRIIQSSISIQAQKCYEEGIMRDRVFVVCVACVSCVCSMCMCVCIVVCIACIMCVSCVYHVCIMYVTCVYHACVCVSCVYHVCIMYVSCVYHVCVCVSYVCHMYLATVRCHNGSREFPRDHSMQTMLRKGKYFQSLKFQFMRCFYKQKFP